MKRFVILVALGVSGSAMAQSASPPTPPSVNKIVAECNKQSGQYQLWLGGAQETIEALQDQIKAAQVQIADLTKKLAAAAPASTPAPTPLPQ